MKLMAGLQPELLHAEGRQLHAPHFLLPLRRCHRANYIRGALMTNNYLVSQLIERGRRINTNPASRGVLSRGQLVEIAILLNRPDWLAEAGFTMADAIDRLSREELDAVIHAARNFTTYPVAAGGRQ